ncbi:MAG: hypothetical protein IPI77_24120 [Saprospiraceae bacterium]|nr:hypothetical protein [Saprospiraceae bacterium]
MTHEIPRTPDHLPWLRSILPMSWTCDHDATRQLSHALLFNISPQFSILVGAYTLTAAISGFVAAFFR